jgi:hypothetical protein
VASYLNATFDAGQDAEAEALIEAAEQWVDVTTAQAWEVTSPSTEVQMVPRDGLVRLRNRPVTAITSVTVRTNAIGSESTTLTEDETYELLDATKGVLAVGSYSGYRATVIYTHTTPAPEIVALATKMLVGYWMRPLLGGDAQGVKSYSVGGELSVTYQDVVAERGVPAEVLATLEGRKRLVLA